MNFFYLFLLFFSFQSLAKNKTNFTYCLGQEEARFHKAKYSGYPVKLNRVIISQIVQLSDSIHVQRHFEKKLCDKANLYPSFDFLALLLTEKENLFYSSALRSDLTQQALDKSEIQSIVAKSGLIFVDLIASMQSEAKTHNCLTKKYPKIKSFFNKAQYTMEEAGLNNLIKELGNLTRLLEDIKSFSNLEDC